MVFFSKAIYLCVAVNAVLVAAAYKFQTSLSENAKLHSCHIRDGNFASPFSCQWFITCKGFRAEHNRCPTPLFFDDVEKLCVCKSDDLKCGPVVSFIEPPIPSYSDSASICSRSACKLPKCFCSRSGTQIPGSLRQDETPQMVILTFTGPLNPLHERSLDQLFYGTKSNPNGCRIKATFFVPHEFTSYYQVQKLYGQGHEIASQTITTRRPYEWEIGSVEEWAEEVIGQRETLHRLSNVSREDLRGMRAPFLNTVGDNAMKMALEFGVLYDSSIQAPLLQVPLWPYTLDYEMPQQCLTATCPRRSFPGIWEFPISALDKIGNSGSCTLIDECVSRDTQTVRKFLIGNFVRHYNTNKAPLILNLPTDWVTDESRMTGLVSFIDDLLDHSQDIWFVTIQQALEWIRHPVSSKFISKFDAWKCPGNQRSICSAPRICPYRLSEKNFIYERYIHLCGECPVRYPWLKNVMGTRASKFE